jgi:hypothetical protein
MNHMSGSQTLQLEDRCPDAKNAGPRSNALRKAGCSSGPQIGIILLYVAQRI